MTKDDIGRPAGREVMRSITESTEFEAWRMTTLNLSGGDALRGHTRSHPEHDG